MNLRRDDVGERIDIYLGIHNRGPEETWEVDMHLLAGPELLAECRALGGCPTGEARITPGFSLPARWVIHTVGPVWRGGNDGEPQLLAGCYRHSLELARLYQVRTIAFPAISCGVYGYPLADACRIAIDTTIDFLTAHPGIARVIFILFSDNDRRVYESYLQGLPS